MIALSVRLGDDREEGVGRAVAPGVVDAPASARFAALMERELDRSYRLAGLLLGDAAEAEDAVGDAIERAWRELPGLRDTNRFQAWFDRIVVNACRDRLRRRARVRFVALDGATAATASDPFREILESDALLGRIRDLPAEEVEIVILHFWADLTLDSVAERLRLRPGTVRSRLHRALGRLRRAEAGIDGTGVAR
jgi:RNA polymerase sigma factor (sigma-70 family)